MPKLNVKDFSAWLMEQVGNAYLWGGQGESVYDLVRKFAKSKNQSDEKTTKTLSYMKKYGSRDIKFYDCSGLAVKYLLEHKAITSDTTASGLYKKCTPISEGDVVEGCWAFLKNESGIYHIGYVVDNDMIVHAFNQEKGVILEKRTERKWFYARPDFAFAFDTAQNAQKEPLKIGSKVTLTKSVNGYNTANNALKSKDTTVTYPVGEYYVYKFYGKAVNITKKKGVPGAWVVL
jgi:cell wall-associated NlpC family hydrolase